MGKITGFLREVRAARSSARGAAPMRVFGDLKSGNCQKVKATADCLGVS